MSNRKLFAMFALGTAFALTAALPAFAADREDKAPREQHQGAAAAQRADVKISGHGDPSRLQFHRTQTPNNRPNNIFEKADCSFTCGDWLVTCSGSSASCADETGCIASGGDVTIIVICL